MIQSLERLPLGRYELQKRIGAGGMGQVYLAKDTHMLIGREVAIKVFIPPDNPNDVKTVLELFEREVKAIAHLNHPHILPIFDYGIQPVYGTQFAYIVMPLCQDSLAAWWQKANRPGTFSLEDITHLLFQAADALQLAHDHNIIHKDVKLENFLIRKNIANSLLPDLLLTDFGIAKLHTATFTLGNLPSGTPPYMPAEQWAGKPVPATDQYALATMLYKIITGRFPYQSDKQEERQDPNWMREQQCNLKIKPEPLSKYNSKIPSVIDDVVLKALSKKPENRYLSIIDFAQAFRSALQSTIKGADINLLLAINEIEALVGTECSLVLPNGQEVIITVPAGAQKGQKFHMGGKGESSPFGGPNGALNVTLALKPADENDYIINELRSLSKAVSTLQSDIRNDQVNAELQGLSKAINTLQSKSKNDQITKELRSLYQVLTTLPSKSNADEIMKQIQLLNDKITELDNNWTAIDEHYQTLSSKFDTFTIANLATTPIINSYAIALAATTSQNLHPPYTGVLALNDPLANNMLGYQWTQSSDCFYVGSAYYITSNSVNTFALGQAFNTNFSNFTYQVQMQIITGDGGGIIFRSDGTCKYYYFRVSQKGDYKLIKYTGYKASELKVLKEGHTSAFHTELNAPNIIAVVAQGNSFSLYINFQHVLREVDMTYNQGKIGVIAENITSATQVAYSNAKVWIL